MNFDIKSHVRQDLTDAIAATAKIMPGIRTMFDAFVMPTDVPISRAMQTRFRQILKIAEQLLRRLQEANANNDAEVEVPKQFAEMLRTAQRFLNQQANLLRVSHVKWISAVTLARAVVTLCRADRDIRTRGCDEHLDERVEQVWGLIGGHMDICRRDDTLVVVGGKGYSTAIRRMTEQHLQGLGATGAWWLSCRHKPNPWKCLKLRPDAPELPPPPGLSDTAVYLYPRWQTWALPQEQVSEPAS